MLFTYIVHLRCFVHQYINNPETNKHAANIAQKLSDQMS